MQLILEPYVLGVISALIVTLTFAVSNILYKKMSEDISVMDIMFTRMWVSLPVAYLFAVISSGSFTFTVPTAALFPLIFSMIIGLVIGDAMYFVSQERIGVSRAFPITMSYPLLVFIHVAKSKKITFDDLASIFIKTLGEENAKMLVPLEILISVYGSDAASKWKRLVGS